MQLLVVTRVGADAEVSAPTEGDYCEQKSKINLLNSQINFHTAVDNL